MANKKDDIIINTDNIDHILYNNQEVKKIVARQKNAQGEIIEQDTNWEQPFALSINKNEGINTITVVRTFTRTLAPINVELHDGDIVYNEDILSVSATRSEYYDVNTYPTTLTVSGNISVAPTATRRVGNIILVKNENVSAVSLTYKDASGVSHTVTAPGTYAAGKGYQYSWTATPNTGYDISQAAGTGVVEENETSDIVSPTASRKLWSLSITKSNYMAEVYYSLNSGTPIAVTSTTQLTGLDFADTVVVTGTTQSETKYDYFNVQGLGTFTFIDNKRTQSTNVCCERDWHKFTITWKYRGSDTNWTTVTTQYIWDDVPGTTTPKSGTVPTPVDVNNGGERYIPTGTWDNLDPIRSNRTITMGYETVRYYATFADIAYTTKPADGWYVSGSTPEYTAGTGWAWGSSNAGTKATVAITEATEYSVADVDRVYCSFSDITNTTKPSAGWYDRDSSVSYTANTHCYFSNQGATTSNVTLSAPDTYSVSEPVYRKYTISGTNCSRSAKSETGYYSYGQTITTTFTGSGSGNNAYRFNTTDQTKDFSVDITNTKKEFINNPTANYVYATFGTATHVTNNMANGWYTLGTHNDCWTADTYYAWSTVPKQTASVIINTVNGTYNPPALTSGYAQVTLSHCTIDMSSTFTGNGWYALGTVTLVVKADAGYSFNKTEKDTKSFALAVPGNAGTIIPTNFYASFNGTNCTTTATNGWYATNTAHTVTWTADEGYCFDQSDNSDETTVAMIAGSNTYSTTLKKRYKLTISANNSNYSKYYRVKRGGDELSDQDYIYWGDTLTGEDAPADDSAISWGDWGTVTNPSATSSGNATSGNITVKNEDSAACVLYYNTTKSTSGASFVNSDGSETAAAASALRTGLSFNQTYYYFAAKTVTRSGNHYTYSSASGNFRKVDKVTDNVTASFDFSRSSVADSESKTGYSDILAKTTEVRKYYTVTWSYLNTYTEAKTATTTYYWGDTPLTNSPRSGTVPSPSTVTSGNNRQVPNGWKEQIVTVTGDASYSAKYTQQVNVTSTDSTYSTAYTNTNYNVAFATGWHNNTDTIYWKASSNCAYNSAGTATATSTVVAGANTKDATHYNVTSAVGTGATAYSNAARTTAFTTGWKAVGTIIYWKITATGKCFSQSDNSLQVNESVVPGNNDILTYAQRFTLTVNVTGSSYGTWSVKRGSTSLTNGSYIYYGDTLTGSSSAAASRYTSWSPASSTFTVCTGSWNGGDCTSPSITLTAKNSTTANLYRRIKYSNGTYGDWVHLNGNWGTASGATHTYTDTGLSFSTTYNYHVAGYQYRNRYDRAADSGNYTGTTSVTGPVTANFKFTEGGANQESNWTAADPSTVDISTGARNKYTISGNIYYYAINGHHSYNSSATYQEAYSITDYWGETWSKTGTRTGYNDASKSGTITKNLSGQHIYLYPHEYIGEFDFTTDNGGSDYWVDKAYYGQTWNVTTSTAAPAWDPYADDDYEGGYQRYVWTNWTAYKGGLDSTVTRDISWTAKYKLQYYFYGTYCSNCSANYSAGWYDNSSLTVTATCTTSYTFTSNADVYSKSVTVNLPTRTTVDFYAVAKPSLGKPTCSKYSNYSIKIYNTATTGWTGHAKSGSYEAVNSASTYTAYVSVPWNGRYWDCYCTKAGWLESTWVSFYLST